MLLLLIIIYLAFISLGLPDAVLGSAWPVMRHDLNASLAFAGAIALVVSAGTVISSLLSTQIIHRFGPGKVVAISVLMTALALLGFTFATEAWMIVLLAIPLGLGAGSVDAALNNFVALHYQSKHMNYLHSFWGVGATAGPLIMRCSSASRPVGVMGMPACLTSSLRWLPCCSCPCHCGSA
ncbi:permeases of the major facilitator superfamily [Photobacterium aphoticum]|uniref:Permeases of the major facilitator superfamily n=1 Tax=Photobacterium aphoticum TaxID=754436 RepID=A0A090RAN2_9GAMM|nr:permeases of the major facilitator superfamily [Photobacterium aphoticum]